MAARNIARPLPVRVDTDRRERLRLLLRARVELVEGGYGRSRWGRGLLEQLRAAKWIPKGVIVDEGRREALEWTDAFGRRCVLRPYGSLQWEVRRQLLKSEMEAQNEARRLEKRKADEAEAWRQYRERPQLSNEEAVERIERRGRNFPDRTEWTHEQHVAYHRERMANALMLPDIAAKHRGGYTRRHRAYWQRQLDEYLASVGAK